MNQSLRLFFTTVLALTISFAFNFLFLNLLERSTIDQILLMLVSTAALGYLIYSLWNIVESSGLRIPIIKTQFNSAAIPPLLREHAPGIALAILFFAAYTYIGLQINLPYSDTTDNFLDADNYPWMQRISAPDGSSLEMRGPHPFAYFIFRPLGWLINLFTPNPALSAILLNTFAGALCVFMAWVFIKRQFRSPIYALLIASLLGLSTSHFFFGSVIETYIFSAAALIGFVLVLQKRTDSMLAPVMMSLITFGITITNFAQNFIGFFVTQTLKIFHPKHQPDDAQKSFKFYFLEIFRFTALTLSLGIVISLIHAAWYPSARLFFLQSDAQIEEDFSLAIFQPPAWKTIGRVTLLIRTILLYTVIAPKPFVFGKEVGAWLPYFNFFKVTPELYSYSSYTGLGNILIVAWAVLLFVSGVLFLLNLIRTRKADISLAFVLSLLFNFVLHLGYGWEPFLYSPDWAYALIFFVALSLAPLAENRLFQGAMLVFLILLAYNQIQFIQFILTTIAPFYG